MKMKMKMKMKNRPVLKADIRLVFLKWSEAGLVVRFVISGLHTTIHQHLVRKKVKRFH